MNRCALITGAAGLVGGYLIAELLRRSLGANSVGKIHCVVRGEASSLATTEGLLAMGCSSDAIAERVEYHILDLESSVLVKELVDRVRPDVVFHTAAKVDVGASSGSKAGEAIVRNNVLITHILLETLLSLRQEGVDPLLVHVSSVAAFGTADPRGVIDHMTPFVDIGAASPYARSKFLSQNDVLRAQKIGLRVVVVCPSVIVGLGRGGGAMERMLILASRGMQFYTRGAMGYVDVRDVARAMVLLSLTPSAEGKIYCLNGANVGFREFFTIFGAPFDRRAPRIGLDKWVVDCVGRLSLWWSFFTWQRPLLSLFVAKQLSEQVRYDGSAIELSLPDFSYTPLSDTAQYVAENLVKK
ncbi:MAG: NAD-dependent epimerase/dehydratase family protein [Mucinivorans sp.]